MAVTILSPSTMYIQVFPRPRPTAFDIWYDRYVGIPHQAARPYSGWVRLLQIALNFMENAPLIICAPMEPAWMVDTKNAIPFSPVWAIGAA